MYDTKNSNYFSKARLDIDDLIKFKKDAAVLEIGCGDGSTLVWLKKTGKCQYATGIDAFSKSSDTKLIDDFIIFDLNQGLPKNLNRKYDAILCLDVLEHLIDPWQTTKLLKEYLKDDGQFIVSLPNIQNYKIVLALLFNGDFNYQEEGILDRTHLRFFTYKTAKSMLENGGFKIESMLSTGKMNFFKKLLNRIGLGNILAKQYIFSCRITRE